MRNRIGLMIVAATLGAGYSTINAQPKKGDQARPPRELSDASRKQIDEMQKRSGGALIEPYDVRATGAAAAQDRHKQELASLGRKNADAIALAAPWEMFADALKTQIAGQAAQTDGLQIVTLPVEASWDHATLGKYRAYRLLGDALPTWGPSYRATAATVSGGYHIFATNLDIAPPDPELRKKAEKARKEWEGRMSKVEHALGRIGDHWADYDAKQATLPVERRISFDEWYAKFDGAVISNLQSDADQSARAHQQLLNQAGGGWSFAANVVNNFNNAAFQESVLSPSGKRVSLRTYEISPDLGEFVTRSKSLGNVPPKIAFGMDHSSRRQKVEETSWSGSASYGFGFFSFGVGASGGSSSVNTSSNEFKMRFEAKNLQVFTVLPGGWFDGTAVKALGKGPFIAGGPVATGAIRLWGPDGVLNVMVTQIVVAYRPKITATVSAAEYSELKSRLSTSGGFSIGPFGFGAAYSRNTSDVKFDDASKTFSAEDTSDVPQIIAVVCSVLPEMR